METVTNVEIVQGYIRAFNIPLWKVVLSGVSAYLGVGGMFRLVDRKYRVITDADEERFFELLDKDYTDREKWVTDFFDCDDFTYSLHGTIHKDRAFAAMPFFITHVEWYDEEGDRYGHYVVSYCKDGIVKVVEPQSDLVQLPPEHWRFRGVEG